MTKKFGNEFKHVELDGYRNINELYEQDSQLHACETLFGDWNAEVMVLAQDAANFNTLKKLKDEDNKNPFRHNPTNKTNKNLYEVLSSLKRFNLGEYRNPNNRNCGLYYANAIWLLKDSSDMSGAITNRQVAYERNYEVFLATLNNLPNLKLILTLGELSFNFLSNFVNQPIKKNWQLAVKNNQLNKVIIDNRMIQLGAIYHTSNRGMIARAKLNGLIGANTCAKGLEITKQDLRNIFYQHELLKGN